MVITLYINIENTHRPADIVMEPINILSVRYTVSRGSDSGKWQAGSSLLVGSITAHACRDRKETQQHVTVCCETLCGRCKSSERCVKNSAGLPYRAVR